MEGPYREPKPLSEVIPPDRRRQRAVVLVLASMVAGAALFQLARSLLADPQMLVTEPPTPRTTATRIALTTLHGPEGALVIPAASQRTIVNVWLQGCADCMPAFEAMQTLAQNGGLQVSTRVVNVAYGEADPSWASRYGVRQNLVFDTGGALLVRPLGISTFTTLVVDADGTILHRDRPDKPGYADRIREKVGQPRPEPQAPAFEPGPLTTEEVQLVVAKHRSTVNQECWQATSKDAPAKAKVTLSLVVGANGNVVSSAASGTDALVASCVETRARTWQFPAHGERSVTIQIPFVFARE